MRSLKSGRGAMAALSISTLLTAGTAHASDPGAAGFLSLRLGEGARASGMGDAQVSLASDATAVYWNPAGLSSVERTSLAVMHNEWLSSVRMETGSVAHATNLGVFGLHFSGLYTDQIDRFETASGDPQGTFNAYEIAVTGAYGRRIRPDWDAGIALKWLHSGLDDVTASGWAADLGVRYRTVFQGLTVAAAAQNLGPKMKFIADEFPLPALGRVGADYQHPVASLAGRVTAALDVLFPVDGNVREHLGLEYAYHDLASLRVGYKTNYDSQGVTFGVGLRQSSYHFDYAFSQVGNELGNGHKFALTIDL